MKIIIKCIVIFSLLIFVSCSKTGNEVGNDIPMSFYAEENTTTSGKSARSLLDLNGINTKGNILTVNDLYTTIDNQKIWYMENQKVEFDGTAWTYSPLQYWTDKGKHSFMAYLSKSGEATLGETVDYPTVTYDSESEKISISQWNIKPTNQFDFLYAYVTRGMEELNPHRPVELSLSHALCAVRFNVVNLIPSGDVTFSGFSIEGMYHTGKMEISKKEDPVFILTDNSEVNFKYSGQKKLEFNVPVHVFSGMGNIGDEGYLLLWPHTIEQFENVAVRISYQYGNTNVDDREIKLTKGGANNWRTGYKYDYNFYIQDNRISFEVKVVPWIVDDIIIQE